MNYSEALTRCIEQREIFHDEMLELMHDMMTGTMPPAIMSALLMGLRVKKETIGEIAAAAEGLRQFATPVHTPYADELVDMCGTGGDHSNTFNISTASMFVAAAAGVKIAKHGNRSASSKSGSADVLEALGAKLEQTPEQIAQSIDEIGIGFMFAPLHHQAMKHIAPIRRELGVRTIFNILGPLTNPAQAKCQLMGVFHPDLVGIQVRVLKQLGAQHVLTVHGCDGLDEASISDRSLIGELKDGKIYEYDLQPEDMGLTLAPKSSLQVNNATESAAMIKQALSSTPSPAQDIVILNAGLALYVGNKVDMIQEGISMARETIQSGAAMDKMMQFIQFTQQ